MKNAKPTSHPNSLLHTRLCYCLLYLALVFPAIAQIEGVKYCEVEFQIGVSTNREIWLLRNTDNKIFRLENGVTKIWLPLLTNASQYTVYTHPWDGTSTVLGFTWDKTYRVGIWNVHGSGFSAPGAHSVLFSQIDEELPNSGPGYVDFFLWGFCATCVFALLSFGVRALRGLRLNNDVDI